LNLLSNAIKFTSLGEVSLELTLVQKEANQAQVRFDISDTGIGISSAQIGNLFKAFSQADESTSRKFGGTGLGLAICKMIVELFGGAISVTSREGRGSTFSFEIEFEVDQSANMDPLHIYDISKENFAQISVLIGLIFVFFFSSFAICSYLFQFSILVVDDNATNCMSLELLMKQCGCRMVRSERMGMDGLATLRAQELKGEPFNLCLLDYHMPQNNGVEVARAIAKQLEHPPKIIALSSSLDHKILLKELNIAACSAKPVRKKPLLYMIQRVMFEDWANNAHDTLKDLPPAKPVVKQETTPEVESRSLPPVKQVGCLMIFFTLILIEIV